MFYEEELLEVLKSHEALRKGHFVLSSGFHSDTYIQCMNVLKYPALANRIAIAMSEPYFDVPIDVVVAPAVGGVVLGFAVAQALDKRFVFAERENGQMALRRGFKLYEGERVLIVDDVVTKGGSLKEVIDLVKDAGAKIVGINCLIDRGEDKIFAEPLASLIKVPTISYKPEECPLCMKKVPLISPGSRRLLKFIE